MSNSVAAGDRQPAFSNNRFFANFYERTSRRESERRFMEPLRKEIVDAARGVVLEVGAGNGLNFAFYDPAQVTRVEAVEPDSAMLGYARTRLETARVPITLTQAPAEALPFPDATFDCALATMVFCSVTDPQRGFAEIKRVLKPGGTLLLVEHVRARGAFTATIQNMITPITTRLTGNCHWNRDTAATVAASGFQVTHCRNLEGGLMPMILLHASRYP